MAGRVVLVTGASSGIGAATVQLLAARGEHVYGLSRSAERLDAVAAGTGMHPMPGDILDARRVSAVVEAIVAEHGRLDAVVHAAQVMAYGAIEDVPAATFEHVVDTAVHGSANVARAVMPLFRKQGGGTFVAVSSLLGQIATPRMGAYDVAKWGQLGLMRVLRLEARDARGIHICTVAPGAVNTPIYDQAANYAGHGGFPPPPVLAPQKVAAAAVRMLDRPRRHVNVGPLNVLTLLGFQYAPWLYERIVGSMVDRFVFIGAETDDNDGNVFTPVPSAESVNGRWSLLGRPRAGAPRAVDPSLTRGAHIRARASAYVNNGKTKSARRPS